MPWRSTYAVDPRASPTPKGSHAFGSGNLGINLVAVVREVDQLALLVIERDVEVVRVHQLADDLVDPGVERRHVLGGARRLGDAVQGGLDLRGVLVRSLAGLELRDLLLRSGQFVGCRPGGGLLGRGSSTRTSSSRAAPA